MANEEQFALFDFDDVASPDKSRDAEKAAETSIAEVEADPVDAANNEPSTADARPDVEPDLGSDVTASSDLPPGRDRGGRPRNHRDRRRLLHAFR